MSEENKEYNGIAVGIGEALWDILPDGKKIGGAPANFAYHVSQFGVPSIVVSAVGHDRYGAELLGEFDDRGLDYLIPEVEYPTGVVMVSIDEHGIPSYDIRQNVAWDNIPFCPELEQLAHRVAAVSFGSLAQRNVVSRNTIHSFLDSIPDRPDVLKVFDINLRQGFYSPEIISESMRRCNVLKINDEELVVISRLFGYPGIDLQDKCWLLLKEYDLRMLILTCGVNGSYVFAPGSMSFEETPVVEVADTVGAGDSFTAAFIASILRGLPMEEAHHHAVEVSAFVCTCAGAMPVLPDRLVKPCLDYDKSRQKQ